MNLNITAEEREGLKNTFKNFGRKKSDKEIFYDLCFCICAPQTKFMNNRKVIDILISKDFYHKDITPHSLLEEICKPVRFYRNKAKYLLNAKKEFSNILMQIKSTFLDPKQPPDPEILRDWLVKNVKGLGMKAASHFLRNLGDKSLAIIDTHIIKFLQSEGLYNWTPLGMCKSMYLSMEKDFRNIAFENRLSCAELDAFVWQRYSKTPWENFKY